MSKTCNEGELHRVEMERSDESLQVLDAKPKVLKRPHLKTHLEHDVKLLTCKGRLNMPSIIEQKLLKTRKNYEIN